MKWYKESKNGNLYEAIGFWLLTAFWAFLAVYTPERITPDTLAKVLWYGMSICLFLLGLSNFKSWLKHRKTTHYVLPLKR